MNGTVLSTDDVVRANPVLNNGRFVYDEGYDRFVLDGQTFHARHGSSIEGFEDGLQFAIGDEFVKLPREIKPNLQQGGSFKLPKEIQYANQFLSGCFNGDHCFLAIHNMYGYPHVTCCIDKNNNEVVWSSKTCGSRWRGAMTGQHSSKVSVVHKEDRVFVFGASGRFYAHCFDANNGKTIFFFATTLN